MSTTAPARGFLVDELDADADEPVRPNRIRPTDVGEVAGAAVSGLSLAWLVYYRLTPASGALGFVVLWYALFVTTYWAIVRERHGRIAARDRMMAVVIASAGLGLLIPLALIVAYVVIKGLPHLRPHFFTEDLRHAGPQDAGSVGGACHAIIGTVEQVGLAMAISVPFGVTTAVFLNEMGGRLARPVRMIVDAMSAIPSIVAGLFIYSVLVLSLGYEQMGFTASLALSILMLPTVTRTAEVVLRLVPGGLREAGLGLGATEWRTVRHVVLPTARTGLVTAVILGIARVVGETAPLILTAGGLVIVNKNPFHGKQDALPLFVFGQYRLGQPGSVARAWTGALVLLLIVLVLFVAARRLGSRTPGYVPLSRRLAARVLRRARAALPRRRSLPQETVHGHH